MSVARSAAAHAAAVLSEPLPSRFEHVVGVATRTGQICAALGLPHDGVVAAAWLHDIGYAPGCAETGFHALDGARAALRAGFPRAVAELVAHHSCAWVEADLRGMGQALWREFPGPDWRMLHILTAADLSVGPGGRRMTVDARLADIRRRYSPEDVVSRFVEAAEKALRDTYLEVEEWLAQSQ